MTININNTLQLAPKCYNLRLFISCRHLYNLEIYNIENYSNKVTHLHLQLALTMFSNALKTYNITTCT